MSERKGTKGLELWCRKMTEGYPGVKIENMTTSWRDGLAFCAMIHHFRPDLIEFDKLNKDDVYHNNELAFRVAEHHLGIPALLEPEDMVEYEVPDRLSILTYLSQFYQTFENQRGKSGARIAPKRPQSTPDHGIVSPASTSPPTKVQITVGRAKREPCAKCGLPVFIAERLNVGKLLYHRTCFRCARCKSQLTLANYYETENSEFCCEICPDEEKIISKKLSSEHSVLMRSMSDEEKTASLKTYSDAPDAYSTHFETALEYPIDGDLKRNFTLTDAESTEFTKARSHFFKSQIEDSSDSGSEDIPPDLPQNKPPSLINSNTANIRTDLTNKKSDSSFPSDIKDSNLVNDSVSVQTNDHFVTKEYASSTSGISVKARMKLFENKDNKSDVNSSSSSSKQVPFNSTQKKKATVVAIDELEDFENISRKDIQIEDTPLDNSDIKLHSDEVKEKGATQPFVLDEKVDKSKESNLELSERNNITSNIELTIKTNALDEETKEPTSLVVDCTSDHESPSNEVTNNRPILTKSEKIIEILDSSQEQETSHITIESDEKEMDQVSGERGDWETSHISIADSPPVPNKHTPSSVITVSDDSFLSANNITSPQTNTSCDSEVEPAKRGYYTAYEVLSPTENKNSLLEKDDGISCENSLIVSDTTNDENVVSQAENRYVLSNVKLKQIETSCEKTNTPAYNKGDKVSTIETSFVSNNFISVETETSEINKHKLPLEKDRVMSIKNEEPTEKNNTELSKDFDTSIDDTILSGRDKTEILQFKKEPKDLSQTESEGSKKLLKSTDKSDTEYPEVLNPFEDDAEEESSALSSSLNPFGETDDEEIISPKPTPAARPKKKIIPSLEEREIKGTPEALSRLYIQRISHNPFEEEDEDEVVEKAVSTKPIPSPRQKRKLTVPVKLSLNPFGSDDEDDKIVPVPAPRIRKTSPSRPEPRPRDTLSITSKGSHGGSNSSISSGSAVGSARKKKPAPRPPLPFRNSESAGASSFTVSPSASVAESPNLSGTIRSRKTKRAPLPPNASTPSSGRDDISKLSDVDVSPINLRNSEESPNKGTEDHIHREKDVKDEENRSRQSQIDIESTTANENDNNMSMLNKSTSGRWKRRKGQAPSRPIPQRRNTKSLPMSEIKRELETIEIQQQGLEKQGVRLEQIIREKCEGEEGTNPDDQVPIEVEDLILQLFELVNEKNELFRRQAELMYLRRQQRLEEEHADVEYQIRCLMLQPEANKTDSDKAREEALINRLVEIVERRNEIIECLEMDRVREAEEDNSISSQLNLYSLKRDGEKDQPIEQEKKDKKKKHKKLTKIIHTLQKHKEKEKEKGHKVELDKDVDETEVNSSTEKKKKKKFNIF